MSAKVVVLGRNYSSRLGMIRAAGMAGRDVIVIKTEHGTGYKKEKIDESSKYVHSYYCAPEPKEDELLEVLLEKCKESSSGKTILLPTDDYTASFIDKNQSSLAPYFLYPNIDNKEGAVIRAMDKNLQKKLAGKAGLAVAEGWTATFNGEEFDVPDGVIFPCFVKPAVSFKGSKFYMNKCDSLSELESHLKKVAKDMKKKSSSTDMLIEQFIRIDNEYDLPGFTNGNDVFLPFLIKKGVIHMGVTGTGTLIPSEKEADTINKLQNMIRDIGFTGLIDIELYESDGRMYFNELNLRFGATGYAATGSGINMPEMLINQLEKGNPGSLDYNHDFEGKTFVSEKVCYQEYRDDAISWKEFQKTIKNADFRFIATDFDKGPQREFNKFMKSFRTRKKLGEIKRKLVKTRRKTQKPKKTEQVLQKPAAVVDDQGIVYCEKPDTISFDAIHEVLWSANTQNRKDGIVLSTSKLDGNSIEERIGEDGYCFVALDNGKLVGTLSVRLIKRRSWYASGRIPDVMLGAVLPEYQGRHISTKLFEQALSQIWSEGYDMAELDTAENNTHAIKVYKHLGFQLVGFKANPGSDHYSVIMAKWRDGCPYSKGYVHLRYLVKKALVKTQYTAGKEKRFGKTNG